MEAAQCALWADTRGLCTQRESAVLKGSEVQTHVPTGPLETV